jgi:hypothetical protein
MIFLGRKRQHIRSPLVNRYAMNNGGDSMKNSIGSEKRGFELYLRFVSFNKTQLNVVKSAELKNRE